MVEKTRHQNGFRPQTTHYEWDETDRLIRVQLSNGEAWCYQYDVLGRRCRKYRQYPSEANYQSHKPRDIHYLWQGDQLSQQQSHYVDGRIVTTQWVYEPGSFRPLAQIRQLDTLNKAGELERGKPELHYAITDMVGNVKELCDPQGQVQWRSEQGLWQALYQWRLERSPKQYLEEAILDPLHCDLRHQGQIVDEETGLYYNRHRYYDPQICQYLSLDPIGLAGGTRPQAYVHNPLEWVDPLGLSGCPEGDNGYKKVEHPTKKAARRAAQRQAGMGKHGGREALPKVPFRRGSRAPQGEPGFRIEVRSIETGKIVHYDPYGHKSGNIPPHYGVDTPGDTTHHIYPSNHDPQNNR